MKCEWRRTKSRLRQVLLANTHNQHKREADQLCLSRAEDKNIWSHSPFVFMAWCTNINLNICDDMLSAFLAQVRVNNLTRGKIINF